MTVQILDELIYDRRTFSIVGLNGKGLYTPNDFGLKPVALSSANWRGYVMIYKIYYKKLVLDNMQVCIEEPMEDIPKINNIIPEIKNVGAILLYYQKLKLKTNYTGNILIAKGYIDGLHDSMGPPNPISFKVLIELNIKNGDLLSAEDLSDKIAEYREKIDANRTQKPPSDLLYNISNTYSLDYVFK